MLAFTLCELISFGFGLNPSIDRKDDRAKNKVVARLRQVAGPSGRILGLGQEWPPNVAMRYGLSDIRNYDSIELSRNLDWLAAIYEPSREARSSRRSITWDGVIRTQERLIESGVRAIVAATPPPRSLGANVDRVGSAYVIGLDAAPITETTAGIRPRSFLHSPGDMQVDIDLERADTLIVRETFAPGWRMYVDGRPTPITPYREIFLSVPLGRGRHVVHLFYDPLEVRVAIATSLGAFLLSVLLLAEIRLAWPSRFLREGLGRSGAAGLESGMRYSPDFSTG